MSNKPNPSHEAFGTAPIHWPGPHISLWAGVPRMLLPAAVLLIATLALLWHGPILQLENYHDFADQRAWFGIPNAADVLSNLAFAAVGIFGLSQLRHLRAVPALRQSGSGYALFFTALLLTALGSSWYHLAPDNARLVWDRLPIALACAGLIGAVWCETMAGTCRATLALAAFAIASVAWWRYTDLTGAGDLRPYLLLQCAPLVLIPLLQWQHGTPSNERRAYAIAIGLFALAKLFEFADHVIFDALAMISGHTLKHLLAAAASGVVAWNLAYRSGKLE